MIKYVNFGNPHTGIHMYIITMYRTPLRNYRVEVIPCDIFGIAVSDAVEWDMFPTWWEARKHAKKKYKEFYSYVNERF